MVAAQGRCGLYRGLLDQLGERVLYHDTDSCIYEYKPNMWNPELGEHGLVGTLTNETLGIPIVKALCPTSKTYCLELASLELCQKCNESEEYLKKHKPIDLKNEDVLKKIKEKFIVKCRDFTLKTQKAKDALTMEKIKEVLERDFEGIETIPVEIDSWIINKYSTVATLHGDNKYLCGINRKQVRESDDILAMCYPFNHAMVPDDQPPAKKARRLLIAEGSRIKAHDKEEEKEFKEIRSEVKKRKREFSAAVCDV